MKKVILKHALANAIQYGKADEKAVLGKVLSEKPKLKKDIKKVKSEIKKIIKEINKWSLEKQKKELKKLGYRKPGKRERIGLPPLPHAKGKTVMRLAPFPSGMFHIGRARMAILNDEYVKKYKGKLLLVIDDTIGSKEKIPTKEAIEGIPEDLKWLGIKFNKTIYKSDRLEIFYKYAEKFLKNHWAYVCTCSPNKLRYNRRKGIACECRERSSKENLKEWKKMLKGKYKEGEAIVRLKTNLKDPDVAFRDRVLLRISNREHPRVGKKYHVWPLLEFSWAIDDHLLKITHILRGKDLVMEDKMERYMWDLLKWKPPVIIHHGLLRIRGVIISTSSVRRKIAKGIYSGWDDPRTWTLRSLKKRGIQPQALRNFIISMGLTISDAEVPIDVIYAENRKIIDPKANRYFFVAEPIEITLDKLITRSVKAPIYPGKRKYRKIPVTKKIFVEKQDFVAYRNKEVRLMHFCNILLNKKSKYKSKKLKDIPKIHWVSKNVKIKIVMPNGKTIKGLAEPEIRKVKKDQIVQFERIGFARCEKKGLFYFAHK
ncbi:MAG: glutamate--tRNA ligase [Candidatus Aenigmatarchaeota archaeon]